MMIPSDSSHEATLCEAFKQQGTHYAAALKITSELFQQRPDWETDVRNLELVQQHLREIEQIDEQVRQVREAWKSHGRPPGKALQAVLDELKPIVQELLQRVTAAEQRARETKEGLAPKMDNQAQFHRMRRAYQATGKHG